MPATAESITRSAPAALAVSGVTSGYGAMDVLWDVSMRLDAGEVVAVIGPNGAGKSTLLKTIFGLLKPRSGEITVNAREVTDAKPDRMVRLGVGYVPQVDNVFPRLTVSENLEMGAFVRPRRERLANLEAVLELFPILRDRLSDTAGRLSGGQRQMVAVGRALMLEPHVLLLDEPSAGLAPAFVDQIFAKVAAIAATGVGVLVVEQHATKALQNADRAYVLATGRNVLDGPAAAMLDSPEVARLYLGG